jgi:cytochrome P450
MIDIDGIDFAADELPGAELHEALARYRGRGPVQPTRFFGLPAWIITEHAALAAAFRDVERFPPHLMYEIGIEGAVGRTFISMDEPGHQVFRRLTTPAFRARAVAGYEQETLLELAHEIVDDFAGRGTADLMPELAARFPYLVITRVLGLPRDREAEFHRWALSLLRFRDDPAQARRAASELTEFLAPIVEARRRNPTGDVISELVQAEIDGRALTDEEIYSHVRLLVPTGGETTHGTLGNLIYALLTHREAWQRVCEDPGEAERAVEEVLRWETSIAVLPRVSRAAPIELCGAKIPASSWVLFAIAGANRDPRVFAEPDRYDIDRNCDAALTFGPGPKSCPGMHLARRNLAIAIQVLSQRLPGLRLTGAAAAAPRRSVLRCPAALRVEW